MNPSSVIRLIVCFATLAALTPTSWAPASAQTPLAQPRAAIIVSGTVRNSGGAPIADASVFFEEKGTSASIDAKTAADGTFSFLSLRAGIFTVRARKEGLREAVSGPFELSLGQKSNSTWSLFRPSHHRRQKSNQR